MKLWRSLLGRTPEVSRAVGDGIFTFNGVQYPIGSSSTAWAKTEDIENDFTTYVQHLYKTCGVVYAVMAARRMLFRQARVMWQEFDDGIEGALFWTPELEVFRKPWPSGTGGELFSRMDQDTSLGGNAFIARDSSDRRAVANRRLRRLRPDWMTIVLTAPPAEAVKSDVAGYWFHPGRRYTAAGEPQPSDEFYLPGELCHWTPDPDPEAQYRGMSWLTPVVREIMADKAATSHKEKFFTNGATLGAIISAKENLTKPQFDQWKDNILTNHQGVERAYTPLFLASPVDVTLQGLDLRQLDFKATQGHGETRVCAAGRVPPIIVGVSEGLEAATYSNYGQARRAFGDGFAHSQWEDAVGALEDIVAKPDRPARLWYKHDHIPFLREDQADAANIAQTKAATIRTYIDAGYEPDSCVAAVDADDRSLLRHSGLYSVQLQPAGGTQEADRAVADLKVKIEALGGLIRAGFTAEAALAAVGLPAMEHTGLLPVTLAQEKLAAGAPEPTPDEENGSPSGAPASEAGRARNELKHYWLHGEGAGRWSTWTELRNHLVEHVGPERAKRIAAEWFHERYGFWPGADKNRVMHGKPPRGDVVGPG